MRVLVAARRHDDAARLLAAVLHHADLLGVGPGGAVQAGSGVVEIELIDERRAAAEAEDHAA